MIDFYSGLLLGRDTLYFPEAFGARKGVEFAANPTLCSISRTRRTPTNINDARQSPVYRSSADTLVT